VARRLVLIVICVLAVAPAAHAATTSVTAPVYDGKGHLLQTPFAPSRQCARPV
jgi:hypothetical protein